MPTLVWHYLTALLYYRTSASCVALAEALQSVSHDRLTRLLQADWSGQRLLDLTCRTLFVWRRGYLIIDGVVNLTAISAKRNGRVGRRVHFEAISRPLVGCLSWYKHHPDPRSGRDFTAYRLS
jgi:hypothetical protein